MLRLGAYYGRSASPREILFEDRTKPHADNIGNGIDTTAAVGVLKAIHGESATKSGSNSSSSSKMPNRIVKDVVCFHAHDYEKVVDALKIDVFEPPVSQVKHTFLSLSFFCYKNFEFTLFYFFIVHNLVRRCQTKSAETRGHPIRSSAAERQ